MLGKSNINQYLLLVVLIFCVTKLLAQPSLCPTTFNPLRCNSHYISNKFVFIGQLVSGDDKLTQIDGEQFWRVQVTVYKSIKGSFNKRTIELYLKQKCRAFVEKGEKHIFTADRLKTSDFNGFVSSNWSSTLKNIPDNELQKIISKIRSVSKGVKQPSIVGKVVQYDSNPLGISGFGGAYFDSILGYDPQNSHPLKEIEITAKSLDDKLNPIKQNSYKTKTTLDGSYEFRDLPSGFYELSLALSDNLYLVTYRYESSYLITLGGNPFIPIKGKKIYVKVSNEVCSEDIRFNIREAGKIKGKLTFENKLPAEEPFLRLLWVESEKQRSDLKWIEPPFFEIRKSETKPENTLEFLFSDLQVGKYILKIIFDFDDEQKNLYYPGVRDVKDAEIIDIKAGEIKNLSISIK